ncbi:hypothetical protein pipiens_013376 [Culex pipiens pipiens]|uniref:Uncharacterized protein n=1 Tax=Culex pipiens pipiens TaxID=38569 RepID=A0ABD1CYL6_CULPP
MDKNKESLKVKLLVRRSLNQLVEQGIMPSPKTSPAIYEQTHEPIERIVKEGLVNYTPTDEAVSPGQALLSPETLIYIGAKKWRNQLSANNEATVSFRVLGRSMQKSTSLAG